MPKPILLLALLLTGLAHASDIKIRSGVNTNYCVPFNDPRCQAFNSQENSRLFERQQMERRLDKLERERELERSQRPSYSDSDYRRNDDRDERRYR